MTISAASPASFAWGWDAVTALATAGLLLGVVIAATSLRQERRRDREQRQQALTLQADAARRDVATMIMIDAYRVIVAAPYARDDTWLMKLETPLSMLQLIMDDDGIRLAIKAINDLADSSKLGPPSLDVQPVLQMLRDRIRDNLGQDQTGLPFSYLRSSLPWSNSATELQNLWKAMRVHDESAEADQALSRRIGDALLSTELLGSAEEYELIRRIATEWGPGGAAERAELAAALRSWVRQAERVASDRRSQRDAADARRPPPGTGSGR
jgi:hypothetical protein